MLILAIITLTQLILPDHHNLMITIVITESITDNHILRHPTIRTLAIRMHTTRTTWDIRHHIHPLQARAHLQTIIVHLIQFQCHRTVVRSSEHHRLLFQYIVQTTAILAHNGNPLLVNQTYPRRRDQSHLSTEQAVIPWMFLQAVLKSKRNHGGTVRLRKMTSTHHPAAGLPRCRLIYTAA
jgi:hypothetical protein